MTEDPTNSPCRGLQYALTTHRRPVPRWRVAIQFAKDARGGDYLRCAVGKSWRAARAGNDGTPASLPPQTSFQMRAG